MEEVKEQRITKSNPEFDNIYEANDLFIREKTYDYAARYRKEYALLPVIVGPVGFHSNYKGWYVKRKFQQNYLFTFVEEGEMSLLYQGKKYSLKKGDMLLIDSSSYHEMYAQNCEYICRYFFFCAGSAVDAYYNICFRDGFDTVTASRPEYIRKLMHRMFQHAKNVAESEEPEGMVIANTVLEIITEYSMDLQHSKKENDQPTGNEVIIKSTEYIEANLTKTITVQELADRARMSRSHYTRTFKKQTGLSPYEYLLDARLRKAISYLETTDCTLDTITKEIGFSGVGNFIRKFKEIMGVTPDEYRKYPEIYWQERFSYRKVKKE